MMELLIESASSYAKDIDNVILVIAILGGFWLFLAEAVFFYFCFKFRRREGQKAAYIEGTKKEEMKWIHWPHNLVLLCDVAIIILAVLAWYNIKQNLPKPDETIRVIAQQWAWKFVHPGLDRQLGTDDDVATIDALHVKKGTTYHFKLESKDVMHSFSVPVFRLKQDAVPGRVITGWFKPTKEGEFDIQCAEMCGIGHGIMGAKIFIESESDHVAWLNKQAG